MRLIERLITIAASRQSDQCLCCSKVKEIIGVLHRQCVIRHFDLAYSSEITVKLTRAAGHIYLKKSV